MKINRLSRMGIVSPSSELARELRQQISQGRLLLGARLPTERELAIRHKVSRTTVRQAMKILQSERLIARQQGRGTFATDPNHAPITSADANWIGALVYGREYYFEPVVQAASAQASRRGYATATGMNDSAEIETLHISAFIKNRVRGVVMAPHGSNSPANYRRLIEAGLAVVLMDTFVPGQMEDYVVVDNYIGTFLATKHLVELGHRRIAYLTYDLANDVPCCPERKRGWLEACRESGLPINPKWVIEAPYEKASEAVAACLRGTSGKNRPTAIVAYNDLLAVVAIEAARKIGLAVPGDLSVVGFDNSSLGERFAIPLTTVDPEHREMGISAVNMLIDKIENIRPRPKLGVYVTPKLVQRQSTAKPGQHD
jgi:GntR family transcriptional regulator of arabinose operon